MEIQSDSLQANKWQRVFHIVSQHPDFLHQNIHLQMQRLYFSRLLAENILVFLLQYMGLMFSTLTPTPFPLWLASGTSCAFIFLRGSTVLPGVWFGSFLAYYMANSGVGVATGSATIFVCQAQALLYLNYRFIYPSLLFYRISELCKFVIASSLVAIISVLLLEIMYVYTLTSQIDVVELCLQWWLADLLAIFIIATALVTADAYFPQVQELKKLNKFILSLVFIAWIGLIAGMMICTSMLLCSLFAMISIVFIVVIARMYGWCGNIVALGLFALLLCMGLREGQSLIWLQMLLGYSFVLCLWLMIYG